MSNRIDRTFARLRELRQKAFVAYVAAGDPDFERSLAVITALAAAGADVIELGLPFSDPLADGIVNQLAAERALRAGMTMPRVIDLIRAFRRDHDTPLVLFTYLNPVFSYGFEAFQRDAAEAGADGILLLDLPPDEAATDSSFTTDSRLKRVCLIAPTTPPERLGMLARSAEGFIYALSRTGVTGAHGGPSANIAALVAAIKQHTTVPVCVGFGINTPEQAAMVAAAADGVIVGSALVKQVELHQNDPAAVVAAAVAALVGPLIAATKAG